MERQTINKMYTMLDGGKWRKKIFFKAKKILMCVVVAVLIPVLPFNT